MVALVIVLTVLLTAVAVFVVAREKRFADYRARYTATDAQVVAARSHSVATSKGSMLGRAAEQLAPVFPGMLERFSPGDWRFLGSPVDFVVFEGLSVGAVQRVVLVEVKSASPRLTDRQAQIRAAVGSDRLALEWLNLRMPKPSPSERRRATVRMVELRQD